MVPGSEGTAGCSPPGSRQQGEGVSPHDKGVRPHPTKQHLYFCLGGF